MPAARFMGEQDRQKKDQFLRDLPDRSGLSLRVRATDPLSGPRTNLLFTMSENTRLRPVRTDANSNIPRNIISYIQAKITDPLSVNPAARMPQYRLTPTDLDAITTALLSMTGSPANSSLARLVVPRAQGAFRPAGAFGELYDRYKCAVCHRFNGDGGNLDDCL